MKRFSTYAKRRFKSLSDHLDNYAHKPRPELLHKVRLLIKEIKALLNASAFCVEGFNARQRFRPFRSIFRMAGEIRQAEVLDELFRIYKINTEDVAKSKILSADRNLVSLFQKRLPEFILATEDNQEKIIDSIKNVRYSCFKKYLNRKKREVKKELFPQLNKRDLHDTRKMLKEIIFLSPMAKKTREKLDPFYDKLQALIGQWHDKQTVLMLLKTPKKSFALGQVKKECRNELLEIKDLVCQFYG